MRQRKEMSLRVIAIFTLPHGHCQHRGNVILFHAPKRLSQHHRIHYQLMYDC
jgi:hypothetical protein